MNIDYKIYVLGLGSEGGIRKIIPVFGVDFNDACQQYIKVLCSTDGEFMPFDFNNEFWLYKNESINQVNGYELA